MSDHIYSPAYPLAAPYDPAAARGHTTDTGCSTLLRLALLGGLIGGSAAAAANLRRAQDGDLSTGPALAATARSAAIGAAATAAAGAVAGAVADQGLLRLGLMFAVGTAVVYGLDQWGRDAQAAADV